MKILSKYLLLFVFSLGNMNTLANNFNYEINENNLMKPYLKKEKRMPRVLMFIH
jgi:hypothetical protein